MALLWLSLLALPLHGMAGVAMAGCPSHEAMGGSTMGMQSASVSSGMVADNDLGCPADDLSKASKINCGASAVCHATVGFSAILFGLPSALPAGAPPSCVPAPVIAFLTGGPDRPPRASLI